MSVRFFTVCMFLAFGFSAFSFAEDRQGVRSLAASGNSMNPNISANFLGIFRRGTGLTNDATVHPHNGFALQEAELQIFADVDPYFKANAVLAVAPNAAEWAIEPEEVFMESTAIPVVTLKAGKFKAAMGKHNTLHTHAYPFIDAPLINQAVLGDEGLNEPGLSLSALVPVSWFLEITLQGIANRNSTLFGSSSSGDLAGVLNVRNLWDLTADATFELALFGATGNNSSGSTSQAYGADLIFKWRPTEGGKYSALIWGNEYLGSTNRLNAAGEVQNGLATWLQWQFAQQWWLQGRFEKTGLFSSPAITGADKQSLLVGYNPSEFSGFRLQVDRQNPVNTIVAYTGSLQFSITVGAHPAHSY